MFHSNDVTETRRLFFSSWQKHKNNELLLPLEKQLVDVILVHPEYHTMLESDDYLSHTQHAIPEVGRTNPFLHIGLHLAIRDQIATNRPSGITSIYQQLVNKYADSIVVEHLLMEPLAECLWHAQHEQALPDESRYMQACHQLLS